MSTESNAPPHWNTGGPKTYSEADLDAAVNASAISPETSDRLKQYLGEKASPARQVSQANEEFYRVVSGYNDGFTATVCAMLLMSILVCAASSALVVIFVAVGTWILSECFVKDRRLSLTGMVLFLVFASSVALLSYLVLIFLSSAGDSYFSKNTYNIFASFVVVVASWFYWARFKVPIAVACGAVTAIAFIALSSFVLLPRPRINPYAILFAGGLITLCIAIYIDSLKAKPQTPQADVAFWLHLVAAPLLLYPVCIGLIPNGDDLITPLGAALIAVSCVLTIFISLCINRRALLFCPLIFIVGCNYYPSLYPMYINEIFFISSIAIGVFMLLLASFWQPARFIALRFLPKIIKNKLPPYVTLKQISQAINSDISS